MSHVPVHLLTSQTHLTASTVVCGDQAATHATWDGAMVTCPACRPCPGGRPLVAPRGHTPPLTPAMSEQQFQETVRQLALARGWLYYHTQDSRHSPSGWVDTVLAKPEHPLLLCELKTSRGRLTPAQAEWGRVLQTLQTLEYHLWRPDDLDAIAAVLR